MKYYFILFFFQFAFSQKMELGELVKQDFRIENTKVLNFKNEFVFIDSVFVENKLSKELYELNDSTNIESLLGKFSQSEKLKHKYYFVDFFIFEKGYGLKKTYSVLMSNLEQFKNWGNDNFKKVNGVIDINVDFDCQTDDVNYKNVIYSNVLLINKILMELENSHVYFSVFNSKCQIFERLKYSLNDFAYYYHEDFIVLKSKKHLILFTVGGNRR